MKIKINASLIALAIAALPFPAEAAGLGRINVLSALGQPLNAEIEVSVTAEEQATLSARIAAPAAFAASRINYSPALNSVRVDVERRGERAVLKLRSDRPFPDPFVDVLIELDWAAGRVVREYTFLLDPPELQLARNARQTRGAAAEAPAQPASTPARPAPAPAAAPVEDSYTVRRGDTLRRIAEQHRAPGVTLEQMLVAIYRQNPDAFDGSNMNRLRAGRILTLPGSDEAAAIEPTAARREVIAQASDFNAYRTRMAAGVAAAPARDEAETEQQAGGRITPRVEEQARGPAGPRDEVKVSRTQVADGSTPLDGKLDTAARLRALEEDIAARDKAIDEANARLQALEETVRQMQRLLELRSQTLAAAQGQAVQGQPAKPAEPLPPATTLPPVPAPSTAPATTVPPKPAEAEGAIPEKIPAKPAPAPQPVPEPGLLDALTADPLLPAAGGGVLVLLLAYLGLQLRKRRAAAKPLPADLADLAETGEVKVVQGETAGGTVNTAEPSVLNTDFGRAGLAIDADEGVDPVAEADVYIAYGRDAQAEEILLDALKAGAERPAIYLKLLEIYAQRGSLKPFESIAGELYARTSGQGEDWAKAAAMGRKLDPNNPLYAQAEAPQTGAAVATALAAGAAVATASLGSGACAWASRARGRA